MSPPYQCAVFDCDGVILQSNAIKSEAFAKALSDEPAALVDRFVDYHKRHGGVSRYAKFRHYFEVITDTGDPAFTEMRIRAALERYAAQVEKELVHCPTVPGVIDFVRTLSEAGIRAAVNSGGDQAELRRVFDARGLSTHFRHVLGSPATKIENMKTLEASGFLGGPGILFGDSKTDFEAARHFGLDFVMITHETEWRSHDSELDPGIIRVKDFTELAIQDGRIAPLTRK